MNPADATTAKKIATMPITSADHCMATFGLVRSRHHATPRSAAIRNPTAGTPWEARKIAESARVASPLRLAMVGTS